MGTSTEKESLHISSRVPPLDLIFWSGKGVGSEISRFAMTAAEMLEYCYATDFNSKIFKKYDPGYTKKPDLVILGEIFPKESFRFGHILEKEGDITIGGISTYKAQICPVGGNNKEHFLVSYNPKTVGKIILKPLYNPPPSDGRKNPLKIAVYMSSSGDNYHTTAYNIIAFHFENAIAQTAMKKLEEEINGGLRSGNQAHNPHLLIGDTNLDKKPFKTRNQEQSDDGNSIYFPNMEEIILYDEKGALTATSAANGRLTKTIDRAWFNKKFVQAIGCGWGFGPQGKKYDLSQNKAKTQELQAGVSPLSQGENQTLAGLSDHTAVGIRLSRTVGSSI